MATVVYVKSKMVLKELKENQIGGLGKLSRQFFF